MRDPLNQLVARRDSLVPIVGSGVSIQATSPKHRGVASWQGLLESGVKECVRNIGPSVLPEDWEADSIKRLRSGDLFSTLAVADEVAGRLRAGGSRRRYNDWLKNTVGQVDVLDRTLPAEILELGTRVLTTNYDSVLETVAGSKFESYVLGDEKLQPAVSDHKKVIIHLHGSATEPETVVLSNRDYQRLLSEPPAQLVQQALFSMSNLVFIGCGTGMSDPNIGAVVELVDTVLSAGAQYFVLVRGSDLGESLRATEGTILTPIAYGAQYSDLPKFVKWLRNAEQGRSDGGASQDPADYLPKARVGTGILDIAGSVDDRLETASELLRKCHRWLTQIEERGAPHPDLDQRAPANQLHLHAQLAASIQGPASRLARYSGELCFETAAIEATLSRLAPGVGKLDLAIPVQVSGRLRELTTSVVSASDLVSIAHDDLRERLRQSDHYAEGYESLAHANRSLSDSREEMVALADQLGDPDQASAGV